MKKLFGFIGRILYKHTEYVYVYDLPIDATRAYSKDEKLNQDDLKKDDVKKADLRKDFIRFIQKDLKRKSIEYTDFYTDTASGKTFFIFGSYKENPFYIPLFYEIFAYIKLQNKEKFSYPYKKLIFKNIEVLKFTIKCYGKK